MRAVIRLTLLALGAALATVLTGSVPAWAGGPTSVIIVNPSTGAAAALYATDADYETLQHALEPAAKSGAEDTPRLPAGPGSAAINVTWLIHDVSVWRVDRVQFRGDDVWVTTNLTSGSEPGIAWNDDWHQAGDARAVYEVFDHLGILDGADLADAPAAQEIESAVPAPTGEGPMTGWWWVVPGIILGAALASLRVPVLSAMRRRERVPRHQLIDA